MPKGARQRAGARCWPFRPSRRGQCFFVRQYNKEADDASCDLKGRHRIAYERSGAGEPVILVDGAMGSRSLGFWRRLAALLAQRFSVIVYDRRGRGESGDTLPYAVEREVEDIEALIGEAVAAPRPSTASPPAPPSPWRRRSGSARRSGPWPSMSRPTTTRTPTSGGRTGGELGELLAADRRGDAVALFMGSSARRRSRSPDAEDAHLVDVRGVGADARLRREPSSAMTAPSHARAARLGAPALLMNGATATRSCARRPEPSRPASRPGATGARGPAPRRGGRGHRAGTRRVLPKQRARAASGRRARAVRRRAGSGPIPRT